MIAREKKTPNPVDLSAVFSSGVFRREHRRVIGRWPVERAFLESILGVRSKTMANHQDSGSSLHRQHRLRHAGSPRRPTAVGRDDLGRDDRPEHGGQRCEHVLRPGAAGRAGAAAIRGGRRRLRRRDAGRPAERGSGHGAVIRAWGATPTTIALIKSDGDRLFLHKPGISLDAFPEPVEFEPRLIQGVSCYHLANPFALPAFRPHAAETLRRARAAGLAHLARRRLGLAGPLDRGPGTLPPARRCPLRQREEGRMLTGLWIRWRPPGSCARPAHAPWW